MMKRQPAWDAVPALRKGLRKSLLPEMSSHMSANHEGIGGFSFRESPEGLEVNWWIGKKDLVKTAIVKELSVDQDAEQHRLELGHQIAKFFDLHAQSIMDSIGHPLDAFMAAEPARKCAENWRP